MTLSLSLPEAPASTIDPAVRANLGPITLTIDEGDGGKLIENPRNGGWAHAVTRAPDGTPLMRIAMNNDGSER